METNFLSLFSQSVKQFPDKIALDFFSECLTYKQLDLLSNQIAMTIINQDIHPNSPILLEVEKSLISIVYIIGILKAGCYYIPVASNIPINRLNYLLENSQSQMAFVYQHYEALQSRESLNCLLIEKNLSRLRETADTQVLIKTLPIKITDPACCLYTSGSTGYPKGVLISHQGLAAFFKDVEPIMAMNHESICLNTAPLIFDVSIIDIFFPLTMGATVHISPEILLPNFILKQIQQQRITHICAVSSTINLVFANAELLSSYDISSLITVMTGAELLYKKTLRTLLEHSPATTIINGYGLTETTCLCTAFIINKDNVNDYLFYPIGKPLAGTEVKIFSEENSNTDCGELLLAGEQLMLGYLNNPEATTKALIDYEGKRYLRTGDIVSYDQDKNLIFHGRNDTQIKINGYRIDLNEIKYTLLSLTAVKEAEVFQSESAIIAALSTTLKLEDSEKETMVNELKRELSHLLPKYMHPKRWIILDDLPKLSTGKTDLKQLYATHAG